MRRVAVRVVVFLLLGAAVNVGVAWVLAVSSFPASFYLPLLPAGDYEWPMQVPERWPAVHQSLAQRTTGYSFTKFASHVPPWDGSYSTPRSYYTADVIAVGWPWPSMEVRRVREFDNFGSGRATRRTDGHPRSIWLLGLPAPRWAFNPDGRTYNRLPVRPRWPEFLGNSAVFGATLALVWYTPGWWRRARRRRCGQCVTCGYPVGISEVCTECGRSVRAKEGAA